MIDVGHNTTLDRSFVRGDVEDIVAFDCAYDNAHTLIYVILEVILCTAPIIAIVSFSKTGASSLVLRGFIRDSHPFMLHALIYTMSVKHGAIKNTITRDITYKVEYVYLQFLNI